MKVSQHMTVEFTMCQLSSLLFGCLIGFTSLSRELTEKSGPSQTHNQNKIQLVSHWHKFEIYDLKKKQLVSAS